jgi:hypothetical protein
MKNVRSHLNLICWIYKLCFVSFSDSKPCAANCSNGSVCNLVLSSDQAFLRFWLTENCRNTLLRHVDRETLPALRRVCHNFASATAPYLFSEINVNFRANTFAKSGGRLPSLRRIGKHVKRLTFRVPHNADSFLPPLLDPYSGEQITFSYEPQLEDPSALRRPRYGTAEMTDLLIRQYPPLFHAATNVPSFIKAFCMMPRLEHVTVHSPDQNMTSKYRRSVADYVLISLRMALERAPLPELNSLALHQLHPSALLHLSPIMSFGSTPNSCRRWSQIKSLELTMDSTPFTLTRGDDHLRVVAAYIRSFSATLETLSFAWTGFAKGPSPLHPEGDSPSRHGMTAPSTFFGEQAQPHLTSYPYFHSQCSPPPLSKPLVFPQLRTLHLARATAHAPHLGKFVTSHRDTLQTADFEDVTLHSGTWKSALIDPLKRIKRAEQEAHATQNLVHEQSRLLQEQMAHPGTRVTVYDQSGDTMAMDVPVCMLVDSNIAGRAPDEDLIIEGELEPQVARKRGFVGGLRRMFGRRDPMWEPPIRLGVEAQPYQRRMAFPWRRR